MQGGPSLWCSRVKDFHPTCLRPLTRGLDSAYKLTHLVGKKVLQSAGRESQLRLTLQILGPKLLLPMGGVKLGN